MWRARTSSLIILGTASVVALAGCGSDSASPKSSGSSDTSTTARAAAPSSGSGATGSGSSSADASAAGAAIKASLAAAKQAKTYRLVGKGTNEGQPFDIDVHFGTNGSDGSITNAGTKISIKTLGQFVYFKAPASYFQAQGAGAAVAQFANKWVKSGKDSELGKGLAGLADGQTLISRFSSSFGSDDAKTAKRIGTSNVGGKPTTTYGDDTNEGTIDVAASGTPYPLKLVSKGADSGTLLFTLWDEPYTVSPPPASQTVNLPSS